MDAQGQAVELDGRPGRGPLGRVEAFDLLRGLCAIAVAVFHVLKWLGLARLHTWGLYGVYIFFLLSGASMSLAYGRRLRRGYPVWAYLALRYVRLAPLFALATTFVAVMHVRAASFEPVELLGRWILNVTFAFGLANPGHTSLVVGGWSLGIEFAFYLVFPLLLALLSTRRGLLVAAGLLIVQMTFVNLVLAKTTIEQAWVVYTQAAAFIGYFAFGVWVGVRRIDGGLQPVRHQAAAWAVWLALLALVGTQNAATAEATLVGSRGILLAAACCGLLVVTLRLEVPRWLRPVASWLGELSYPMYLLHPIIYHVLSYPRFLGSLQASSPVLFAVTVLVVSCICGTLVFRLIEAPILRWGKRRIG
jgi:peptidoglycan/LPS O-acetylase OafA/YrhL